MQKKKSSKVEAHKHWLKLIFQWEEKGFSYGLVAGAALEAGIIMFLLWIL